MSEPKLTSNNFENHCGHTVNANMKFCPECGAEIISYNRINDKIKEIEIEIKKTTQSNKKLIIEINKKKEKVKKEKSMVLKKREFFNRERNSSTNEDFQKLAEDWIAEFNNFEKANEILGKGVLGVKHEIVNHFKKWKEITSNKDAKSYLINQIENTTIIHNLYIYWETAIDAFNDLQIAKNAIEKAETYANSIEEYYTIYSAYVNILNDKHNSLMILDKIKKKINSLDEAIVLTFRYEEIGENYRAKNILRQTERKYCYSSEDYYKLSCSWIQLDQHESERLYNKSNELKGLQPLY